MDAANHAKSFQSKDLEIAPVRPGPPRSTCHCHVLVPCPLHSQHPHHTLHGIPALQACILQPEPGSHHCCTRASCKESSCLLLGTSCGSRVHVTTCR